jgi:endogenous inhibitor of DNA gyrase (YacG/DUF329 family)
MKRKLGRKHYIKCVVCGNVFVGYSGGSPYYKCKYCSDICRWVLRKRVYAHKCPICGKLFTTKHHFRYQRYCSPQCRGKSRMGIVSPVNIKCAHCSKIFTVPSCLSNRKYCSIKCYTDTRCSPITRRCAHCGKRFKTYVGNMHTYCSWECRSKGILRKGNPNWRHGHGSLPYGSGFTYRLKKCIKIRDRMRCVLCKREFHPKGLHIHHISGNKFNHRGSNLVSLCRTCHWKTFKNLHYWGKLFRGYINEIRMRPGCNGKS